MEAQRRLRSVVRRWQKLIRSYSSAGMLRRWVYDAGLTLAVIICFHNATQCDFVFDDVSAIKDNRDLRPHTPLSNLLRHDFWGTPIDKEQSHKSYRPLTVLTFRWNYCWHQLRPWGYHAVNLLLHIVVSLLYFRMCSVFVSDPCSFLASLLFAVHPVHTEAVTGVVGRAELLSSLFFILAFLLFVRATRDNNDTDWCWMSLSMVSIAAAILSKEQGITVIAVCLVYEVLIVRKLRLAGVVYLLRSCVSGKSPPPDWLLLSWRRLSVLLCTALCLLMARVRIQGAQLPVFTKFDNPASASDSPVRQLTYLYLVGVNAGLLLAPCQLCCDWTMGTVPLVTSGGDPRLLAPLAVISALAALAWRAINTRGPISDTIIMSLSLMVFPFLPASNLFFPVGFVVAERVLYMPSMGFCLLVALGCNELLQHSNKCFRVCSWLALYVLLLSHSARCVLRNLDWRNEYEVFSAGLRVTTNNAKLFNNVGHALESRQQYLQALRYFRHAVSVQYDDIGAHINVGRTLNRLERYDEAEAAYRKALELLPRPRPGQVYETRIAPSHLAVFLNLAGLLARNSSRLDEADQLYRQAIGMRSDYTQAYINRGDVLLKLNRTKDAQNVYEQALTYDNTNPDIYYNLAVVQLELGRPSQAHVYLEQALLHEPDHQQALLNSAALLQEAGDAGQRPLARQRLLRLLQLRPALISAERVYFNLAMLDTDDGLTARAELSFRKAVELKPDFRSALFNLALLLSDSGRPLEAVPFLRRLVQHHPDHVKALVLLGDIYINVMQDLQQAEQCYLRILELDPTHVQGLHNLCVVLVERGELTRAEQCLLRAVKMAPHEEYIQRHLRIVRSRISAQTDHTAS